jgi:hypothetical protein
MHEYVIIPPMPKIEVMIGRDGRITEDGDGSGKQVILDKFSMGGLKGYIIALQDLESQGIKLSPRDRVTITCTGHQESLDNIKDDMAQFTVEIER